MPPYTPLVTFVEDGWIAFHATIGNYLFLFEDSLYIDSYLSSLKIALVSTMLTLLLGYPIAYGMMRAPRRWRFALLMMVILPFWTSFLIRVYAWIRSEEHTSELQSLMRISYAVFCLKKKKQ